MYVICVLPSERVMVAMSDACTPLPAWTDPVVVSGGHAVAHAPTHFDDMPVSACHRYTERPAASVRNVPAVPPWVSSVTPAAEAAG